MNSNGVTLTDSSADGVRDWPWWQVREELARRGISLADVGRLAGVTPNAVYMAARSPRMRLQAVVGDLIGLDPRLIWPSRYAADGRPLTESEMTDASPIIITRVRESRS